MKIDLPQRNAEFAKNFFPDFSFVLFALFCG